MPLQQGDTLRHVLDSVFRAPAYRWVPRPSPFAPLKRELLGFAIWLDNMRTAHPTTYQVVLLALVTVLVVIVVHIGWLFMQTIRRPMPTAAPAPATGTRHDEHWYRREADRLASAGRYAEAMQAEFLALVLALDARHVLRFDPSRTPAEYAHDGGLPPGSAAAFRDLVAKLYGYAFARWPCGREELAAWRAQAAPDRYATAH